MKVFVVSANDEGQRLDKFIRKAAPQLPMSLLYKAIRQKRIKLGGKRCSPGDKLARDDEISVYLPDELLAPKAFPFLSAPAVLDVVYEDENILLVNKPQGLLVHEDSSAQPDTLIARVHSYLYRKGEYDPAAEQSFAPALCNRIDRNTGGIVIAAKNAASLRILNEKIKQREVKKLYLCVLHGIMDEKSGVLKGYIIKDERTNSVRVFAAPAPGAKIALTRYRALAEQDGLTLAEAELLTGRTHQIRAQFANAGHPLLGDAKYGSSRRNSEVKNRQELCAYKLTFDFKTPAESLNYLSGRTFQVREIPFAARFDGFDT